MSERCIEHSPDSSIVAATEDCTRHGLCGCGRQHDIEIAYQVQLADGYQAGKADCPRTGNRYDLTEVAFHAG